MPLRFRSININPFDLAVFSSNRKQVRNHHLECVTLPDTDVLSGVGATSVVNILTYR